MTEHDDLRWLADEQPGIAPPDATATARARTALLEHAGASHRPTDARAPSASLARRGERRWLRPSRVLALAAVAAAGVVAAGVIVPFARDGSGLSVDRAAAAPLVRLADRVSAEPVPAGDATLVFRHQAYPSGPAIDGFDLYADDGDYFYGATRADLRAAVAQDSVIDQTTLVLDAAAAAATDPDLDRARRRMEAATWGPGGPPSTTDAPAAPAPSELAQGDARAKAAVTTLPPASAAEIFDNRLWMGSMDALISGSGRRDVRAGVLRLLATMDVVRVSEALTPDGGSALLITCSGFSEGYQERLLVDAATGVPVSMEGGVAGARPDVVVTYDMRRVTVADLARG